MKKVRGRISGSIMIVFLLMVSFIGSFVYADDNFSRDILGKDITNDILTNLEVNNDQIADGEQLEIKCNFKLNTGIKAGDYLEVNWEKDAIGGFSGYVKNIDVKYKNDVIGKLVVTENKARIVFTDQPSKYDDDPDCKGGFFFTVNGRNVEDTAEESVIYRNITCGKISKQIEIKKGKSGTNSVFYYKTGHIDTSDTENINWWLNANLTKEHLDNNIYIYDYFQDGYELNDKKLDITVNGNEYFQTIKEFNKRYPHSYIGFNNNGADIEIVLNRFEFSGKSFSVHFKTEIIDESKEEFSNKSKIIYRPIYKDQVTEENNRNTNFIVKNISCGAWANLVKKGEVRIYKYLEGTKEPIKGVKFELKKDGKVIDTLTTDNEGKVRRKGLKPGEYILKETSAPKGIDFNADDAKEYKFTVSDSDTKGKEYEIYNKLKTTNINVSKVWENYKGEVIKAPTDKVEVQLCKNGAPFGEIVTLNNNGWSHTFENLPSYDIQNEEKINYTVKEVGEEDRKITIDGKEYSVTVEENADGFVITNKEIFKPVPLIPAKTKVQVKKVWKDYEGKVIEALADKEVEVQLLKNGIETDKFVVLNKENKWQGEFTDLPTVDKVDDKEANKYTVKEAGEKDGRITIDGKEYSVSVEKNAEGYTITNTMVEPEKPVVPDEPKEEPKDDPKEDEPKDNPKDDPKKDEPKDEPKDDPKKDEPKDNPKEPKKPEEKPNKPEEPKKPEEKPVVPEEPESSDKTPEKPVVPESSDKTPATPVTPEATEETTATPEKPETTEEESEKPMIFEKIVVKSTPEDDDEEEDNPLENETSEEKKEPESTNKTDDKKSSEDKSPQTFVGSIYFNIAVLAVSFLALMACKIRKAEK